MSQLHEQFPISKTFGNQEFCRTNFGSKLLAAEGEEGSAGEGVSEVKQYPSGSG